MRMSQMVEPLTKMEKSIAATARPLIWTPIYQVLTMPLTIMGVRVPRIAMAPAETVKYMSGRAERGEMPFEIRRAHPPPPGIKEIKRKVLKARRGFKL